MEAKLSGRALMTEPPGHPGVGGLPEADRVWTEQGIRRAPLQERGESTERPPLRSGTRCEWPSPLVFTMVRGSQRVQWARKETKLTGR